jgi:nucleoside-diphosphate-sugar epimerase
LKKNIFIIGGCGFLGQELTKIMPFKDYKIFIVDKKFKKNLCSKKASFLDCDIIDEDSVNNLPIKKNDIIINLASRQYQDKVPLINKTKWFEEVNYLGAKYLFNKSLKAKASKYIFFSSDMVYGIPKKFPVKEDYSLNPIGPYGKSKLKTEKFLQKNEYKDISIVIFRSRLISGPGRLGVFKKIFKLIYNSLPIPIIGNGENYYQMISVYDCANAILKVIDKDIKSNVFNLGSENLIKVNNLIKGLNHHATSKSKIINIKPILIYPILYLLNYTGYPILYPEQFNIADKNIILDISKSKKILNWKPKYGDLEMIKKAYDSWIVLPK